MRVTRALFVVVVALGMAPLCAGSVCLQPPQNVTVHIVDRNITLKWDWDNPCGLNVTFSADYQEIPDYYETALDSLTVISKCQNVVITECDLSSAVTNYFGKYNVNVTVESGGNRSLSTSLEFWPYLQAEIGPPEVQLESIDGEVKINILHPEAKQAMWRTDTFTYKLVFWKNSSSPEEKTQYISPGETIHDLEPEMTYCLKVKAHHSDHNALYSQIHCIQTSKAWVGLPRPTSLKVNALNMKCLLYWDNLYDGNVSFIVQFLRASQKSIATDISKAWLFVPGCENITISCCDFSSSVHFHGIYYLRVQAMNSHNKSLWSKELEFDPTKHNEIGPPSVYVNASEDSLHVFVLSSKEPYDDLSYHIWYWKNSSYAKEKYEDKSTPFTISDLTSSTLYCLQVQAFSRIYNKSSELSNVICTETVNGKSSYSVTVFLFALFGCILVIGMSCGVYCVWRRVKNALFPKCTPPHFIENIGGKNIKSSYLLTSAEEPTENCVIIDNSIPNEVNLPDLKNHRQSEHVSQDSGNYSNDYGIFENKDSHETPEQEAV